MVSIWFDTNEFDPAELTGLSLTDDIKEFSSRATGGTGGKVYLYGDSGTPNERACAPTNQLRRYCTSTETTFGSCSFPFFYVVKTKQHPNVVESMAPFFNQKVFDLKLNGSLFMPVKRMAWFGTEIQLIYWRSCFSYIMCTIIAFFEDAYIAYTDVKDSKPRRKRSMALTGVQGTGKSILCAIIALFMENLFGWQVHYCWNGKTHVFGNPSSAHKVIHIYDLSLGGNNIQIDADATFILLVSSSNEARWQELAQQHSWSEVAGNYCFIDPATKEEIADMGEAVERQVQAVAVYEIVGGVPRLCLENNEAEAKSLIDSAVATFSIEATVTSLSRLNDSVAVGENITAGTKLYPGLIGHICPTNTFRNKFKIKPSSAYVANKIHENREKRADNDTQELMNSLLDMPKARSFGGWIWEPLLTKQVAGESCTITIVGSELPVTATTKAQVLFQQPVNKIESFEFNEVDDFKTKLEKNLEREGDVCVFAKAVSDTFAAIAAVLITRTNGTVIITGLQMTVAECYHPVQQATIVILMTVCKELGAEFRLLFLQPEKCLSYFGFVSVQAMVFAEPQFPKSENTTGQNPGRPKRKRSRIERFGDLISSETKGQGRMQSNNRDYWHDSVKSLKQFVGIVHLEENSASAGTNENEQFVTTVRQKMKTAKQESDDMPVDPNLRPWKSTLRILDALSGKVDGSFFRTLKVDIACDKLAVEGVGFDFSEHDQKERNTVRD